MRNRGLLPFVDQTGALKTSENHFRRLGKPLTECDVAARFHRFASTSWAIGDQTTTLNPCCTHSGRRSFQLPHRTEFKPFPRGIQRAREVFVTTKTILIADDDADLV